MCILVQIFLGWPGERRCWDESSNYVPTDQDDQVQEVRLSRTEGQQRRRRVCPRLGEAVHISAGLTFGQREAEISANLPKRQTGRAVPTRSILRRAREDKTFEGESFESVQARAVEDGRGQGSSEKKMVWHRSKMKTEHRYLLFLCTYIGEQNLPPPMISVFWNHPSI